MITREHIEKGIQCGLITFEKDSNAPVGTVARIGEKIFYFDTERTEIQTPAEYLGTMDKETLALLIEEAISELKNELPDYYQYFESALSV